MERAEDKKLAHASVGYEHPSASSGEFCRKCSHYINAQSPRCELVALPIRPMDWCHRFRTKGLAAG